MTISDTSVSKGNQGSDNPVRVMLVDDSPVIRGFFTRFLEVDSEIDIVCTAGNGEEALDKLKANMDLDVIILDIEMPIMDGMTALPKLLEIKPQVKVIMASTLTLKNAEVTLQALEIGAAEALPKPSSTGELQIADGFKQDLLYKTKSLGRLAQKEGMKKVASETSKTGVKTEGSGIQLKPYPAGSFDADVLAIGSSTGGPQALLKVTETFKGKELPVPVLITQHMPETFTTLLAEHIQKNCGIPSKEAEHGEVLKPGHVYVAPGGYHLNVKTDKAQLVAVLNQEPPENFCRPAVDQMLRSLVDVCGRRVLSVILTGMGHDGLEGCKLLSNVGGIVLAQDKESSIVWGMPAAVAQAGICNDVLALDDIGAKILKILGVR